MESIKSNEIKIVFKSAEEPETDMALSFKIHDNGVCYIKILNSESGIVFSECIIDPEELLEMFIKLSEDIDDFIIRITEYAKVENKESNNLN